MKTLILGLGFLLSSPFCANAQSKAEKNQASSYGTEAIHLINRDVSLNKAIDLLEKAKYIDPGNITYPFQEARVFFNQYKYDEVVEILSTLTAHKDVTPQVFQLLGNAYKRLTEYDKAIDVYKKGIEKFPDSGMLFHEKGVAQYRNKKYNKAMSAWENGIKANPKYASNYYSLGKLLSYSSETIWALLYGEMFMNLEPTTERSEEMSLILYNTYKKSIHLNNDTTSVKFTEEVIKPYSISKKTSISFPFTYGLAMVNSISSTLSESKDLNLAILNTVRKDFITQWYKTKKNKLYPNTLFDFQKVLIDKGFSEAYNYWMFMHGNKDEFKTWVSTHETQFNAFVDWFKDHRVKHNKKHYFSRMNYKI